MVSLGRFLFHLSYLDYLDCLSLRKWGIWWRRVICRDGLGGRVVGSIGGILGLSFHLLYLLIRDVYYLFSLFGCVIS